VVDFCSHLDGQLSEFVKVDSPVPSRKVNHLGLVAKLT